MQKSKPILTDKQQTPLSSVYGTTVHENIPSPKSQIPEIQEDENISENPNTTTTTDNNSKDKGKGKGMGNNKDSNSTVIT